MKRLNFYLSLHLQNPLFFISLLLNLVFNEHSYGVNHFVCFVCLFVFPLDWKDEAVSSHNILKLIYHGRFLHGNVSLAGKCFYKLFIVMDSHELNIDCKLLCS